MLAQRIIQLKVAPRCSFVATEGTRMHSSRMRTVRSSGRISGGGVPGPRGEGVYLVPGGVYLVPGGVPGQGGVPALGGGVYLVKGSTWSRGCTCSRGVYQVPGRVYLVQGGVPCPRGGCTWSWGVYLVPGGGVPGLGGVPGPGGVPGLGVYLVLGVCNWSWGVYLVPGVCTWSQGGVYLVRYSPPPVDRHTPVKHNLRNFVADGKYLVKHTVGQHKYVCGLMIPRLHLKTDQP